MQEYFEEFEALLVFIPNIFSSLLESTFLNRLKEEIIRKINMLIPTNLRDMINLAQLVEKQVVT